MSAEVALKYGALLARRRPRYRACPPMFRRRSAITSVPRDRLFTRPAQHTFKDAHPTPGQPHIKGAGLSRERSQTSRPRLREYSELAAKCGRIAGTR